MQKITYGESLVPYDSEMLQVIQEAKKHPRASRGGVESKEKELL